MAGERTSIPLEMLTGGLSNAIASGILNPMDVCKTRMQTHTARGTTGSLSIRGFQSAFVSIYAEAGLRGLWLPGLQASLLREMLYCGPRVGLYPTVRDVLKQTGGMENDAGIMFKTTAAIITGLAGSLVANPTDVVKIRLQKDPARYPSTLGAFGTICREEGGVIALWRGLAPSATRGAVIAVGELTTYDVVKSELKMRNVFASESPLLHVVSSLVTGVVATTVAAPFDIIKTRCMADGSGKLLYTGPIDCVKQLVRNEGFMALFKGWWPAYFRLGPHALIQFPILEQLRLALGLDHF